jgi:hypothetical protein
MYELQVDSTETQMMDRMTLADLAAQLPEEDRAIIRGHIEGMEPEELGVTRWRLLRVIHRLAVLYGAERACPVCGEVRGAAEFDFYTWCLQDGDRALVRCLACEPVNARHCRHSRERREEAGLHAV